MNKYIIPVISAAIISGFFSGYYFLKNKEVNQFVEVCFDFDGEIDCGIASVQFNGKGAKQINPDFYDDRYAFWILDTIHSYDCSRIESAMKKVVEDKPLYDYFDVNLDICIYEVENDKREKDIYINTDIYKYEEPNLDIYPEDTIFVAPSEYA